VIPPSYAPVCAAEIDQRLMLATQSTQDMIAAHTIMKSPTPFMARNFAREMGQSQVDKGTGGPDLPRSIAARCFFCEQLRKAGGSLLALFEKGEPRL